MLTDRQLEVVFCVVSDYIKNGESVGSRTVSKKYLQGHSAATIRNEMSDLEDMGYLLQPHASSGRIPTTIAYRLYVDALLKNQRQGVIKESKEDRGVRDIETSLMRSANMLSRLTQYIGLSALAPLDTIKLHRVNFVRLDSSHIMTVIILEGGIVYHRTVSMPCDLSQDSLDELARKINNSVTGRAWEEVRGALNAYITQELEEYALCSKAISEMDDILTNSRSRFYTGKMSQMLGLPDFQNFQNLGRLHALISLLEEESGILDVVTKRSVESGVNVLIGEESNIPQLEDCSLVLASSLAGSNRAILGIIGPKRMNYEQVIGVLEAALSELKEQEE